MKLLVCISKAPDTTSKISFTDGDTKFDENGVQYIVNPYDEWYALVRALELTEANGGTVTTITVGTAADDPTIRKALAIGATDAVRVDAEAKDPYFVAKQIAEYAKANIALTSFSQEKKQSITMVLKLEVWLLKC